MKEFIHVVIYLQINAVKSRGSLQAGEQYIFGTSVGEVGEPRGYTIINLVPKPFSLEAKEMVMETRLIFKQ